MLKKNGYKLKTQAMDTTAFRDGERQAAKTPRLPHMRERGSFQGLSAKAVAKVGNDARDCCVCRVSVRGRYAYQRGMGTLAGDGAVRFCGRVFGHGSQWP